MALRLESDSIDDLCGVLAFLTEAEDCCLPIDEVPARLSLLRTQRNPKLFTIRLLTRCHIFSSLENRRTTRSQTRSCMFAERAMTGTAASPISTKPVEN